MKIKVMAIFLVAVFATLQMSIFAAAPNFEAKANKPTIDGIINTNEYGAVYTMDQNNASKWAGTASAISVKYYFAWSDEGLYIAYTSPNVIAGDMVQVDLNPKKLIANGGLGIFITMIVNADKSVKVLRHNYQPTSVTPNADGIPNGFDISSKVTSKATIGTGVTNEIFIPIAQLQVKSVAAQLAPNVIDATSLSIKNGDVWGLGTYAILLTGETNAWTSLFGSGATAANVAAKAFNVENLGNITFGTSAVTNPVTNDATDMLVFGVFLTCLTTVLVFSKKRNIKE